MSGSGAQPDSQVVADARTPPPFDAVELQTRTEGAVTELWESALGAPLVVVGSQLVAGDLVPRDFVDPSGQVTGDLLSTCLDGFAGALPSHDWLGVCGYRGDLGDGGTAPGAQDEGVHTPECATFNGALARGSRRQPTCHAFLNRSRLPEPVAPSKGAIGGTKIKARDGFVRSVTCVRPVRNSTCHGADLQEQGFVTGCDMYFGYPSLGETPSTRAFEFPVSRWAQTSANQSQVTVDISGARGTSGDLDA